MKSYKEENYEEWSNRSYVSEFLSLKCSGDVLNICSPIGARATKEITEAMGIVKKLRSISLRKPMEYSLYDFCAGNALGSVISIFLLPIKYAYAIDKKPRKRKWELARRFSYVRTDIYDFDPDCIDEDSVIIGIHACSDLSERIIEIYNQSKAKHLILMPCCNGSYKSQVPYFIEEKIGKYVSWCWYLSTLCEGRVIMTEDSKILSPKNIIIKASKD